ncbi:protein SAWADEE HOMEODOMAIN HOMOLOG 1 isoform X1 [Salvia splendens]|uniref:protein SAWADEE HOMEODOMAIN HOMOLOG 1 isoform X1 n=1 Tax=Salvia splendens TaxID=180675 RepID=UPI001C269454|nr:protein SAWADEE HOMEODOMAIN HOMOLOG 1 isoform X1 [Salvia splendens]
MADEDNSPEFTLDEMIEMESLLNEIGEKTTGDEFCRELSIKFNGCINRAEKPRIDWEQLQRWFRGKLTNAAVVVVRFKPNKGSVGSKTAVLRKRSKVPTIPASEAAVELQTLIFEARSAKDSAWFDVASFLSFRVTYSGDLFVRVRFAGFGKEEDEWVSVSKAVRERSIPLEHSECDKVSVGDLVLCFREAEDHALYCDARVVEVKRMVHDSSQCSCIFTVRWDDDGLEGKVPAEKLCYRPRTRAAKDGEDRKLVPLQLSVAQGLLQLL